MCLAVHHLRQKWWWWSIVAPRWSVLASRLGYARLLQDGLLHVLLPDRWCLLLKVEGNMGGNVSSSMATAMTTTMASEHKGLGVTIQTFKVATRHLAANIRS